MNKMKIWFSTILFIIFNLDLSAQKPTILIGNHKVPGNMEKHDYHPEKQLNGYFLENRIIGSNTSSFFITTGTIVGQTIIQYDINTLEKINEFIITNPKVKGVYTSFDYEINDEMLSIFTLKIEKKSPTMSLILREVSLQGNSKVNEKILITTSSKGEKHNEYYTFKIFHSQDKSKIMVEKSNWVYNDETEIEFWVFDRTYNEIFKKKVSYPGLGKELIIKNHLITNDGSIITTANFKQSKTIKGKYDLNYLKLFRYKSAIGNLEEIKINPIGSFLETPTMKNQVILNEKENLLLVTGLYNSGSGNEDLGIAYLSVDLNTWSIVTQKFNNIESSQSKEILTNFEKTKIGKDYGIENIFINNLYSNDGTELKVISEVSYRTTEGGKNNNESISISHKNQIVEFNLDKNGVLSRVVIIPKFQKEMNFALGYIPLCNSKYTVFIYNDNTKNFSDDSQDPFKFEYKPMMMKSSINFSNSTLVYTFFDGTGKLIKKQVYDSQANDIVFLQATLPTAPIAGFYRINDSSVIAWISQSKPGVNCPFVKITLGEE